MRFIFWFVILVFYFGIEFGVIIPAMLETLSVTATTSAAVLGTALSIIVIYFLDRDVMPMEEK